MSSSLFSQPEWTKVNFNGTTYRYFSYKAPAESTKPTLLLLHGFPTGPYTWRAMIPLLKEKGYSFIIPELLGYGETDRPADPKAYGRKKMSDELIAILDKEGASKVVVFGHDHGSLLASTFVRLHPERSTALILACVAYSPPSPTGFDVDQVHALVAPIIGYENFGYFKLFLRPDAPKLIEEHLDSFISLIYVKDPEVLQKRFCAIGSLEESLLQDFTPDVAEYASPEVRQELKTYLSTSGLVGPLAWYHAITSPTINAELESSLPTRLSLPYLFFATTKDAACPPILTVGQESHCDDLTVKEFETGHWVSEEEPARVAEALDAWIVEKGLLVGV